MRASEKQNYNLVLTKLQELLKSTEASKLKEAAETKDEAEALKEKGIKYEHKTFPRGFHGLSVPNDDWATGNHGEPYTAEQSFALVKAIKDGKLEDPDNICDSLLAFLTPLPEDMKMPSFPEVLVWPEMADNFIKSL